MLGLMGGTFNPIHNGHLHMAQALMTRLALDEVHFIPSAQPPHRPRPEVSASHRAKMVELAIHEHPGFVLDTRELERNDYSYTIDTLISLRKQFGENTALCWLMGSDAFASIDRWYRWQELLDYCHIVVVQRPGNQIKPSKAVAQLLSEHICEKATAMTFTPAGKILPIEVDALNVSSTSIRQKLAAAEDISGLLPLSVQQYIKQHGLYQSNN